MELREYFDIGLTVNAYTQLLDEDQTDLHKLYERRAEIDKTAVEAVQTAGPHNILVVTEPWCGDSLAIFPVVAKLFAEAGGDIRVVRRDEQPDLIDRYLTNGGRAIPIVIVLDKEFNERFHWGPRPAPAQAIVAEHKAAVAAGEIDKAEVHKKVRAFYARDHGKTVVSELVKKFGE
ncbi:thioredoxin family protein [Candidatus Bipolaricaulota bacterium]|nr:thioredoxin family protein [Candidatus Bipolaricaulota bacterium]